MFYTQVIQGGFCTRSQWHVSKGRFTDIGNTVLLTSKLREVHSCTAHDIVQLGVYTELNISNVGKLQFLDDKEIKIKFVLASGHQFWRWGSVVYRRVGLCLSLRPGPPRGRSHGLQTGPARRDTRLAPITRELRLIANRIVIGVKLTQPATNWCGNGECGLDDVLLVLVALLHCYTVTLPGCLSKPFTLASRRWPDVYK